MNPFANSPSSEPTRMEIQYRLTPEQEQLQRQVLKTVQGARWIRRAFLIFFVLAFLAVMGGIAFVVVHIAATFAN